MRIVLLIDWFLYYTIELANALAKEHEVMLITRDHNFEVSSPEHPVSLDGFLDECLDKNILREKIRYRRSDIRNLLEILRVYKRIKAFIPEVIHIQENTDWRIYLLAKFVGFAKTVLTIHDVCSHPGEKRGIQGYLSKKIRENSRYIVVHGEYLKRQLVSESEHLKSKTHVIPHGALSIYKKWDTPWPEEEHAILFFGRIAPYKGIDILIKATPLIAKEIPDVKIIIAGNGEDFSKYRSLITDKEYFEINNRFISNHEVPKFFRRASVVVLPYIEASQSGVVAVAYAFGKPVVVTDVGSIPEVVDEGMTGFVIPPNNSKSLANALIKILKDNELRKQMGTNALNKAHDKLSWRNIAKETVTLYLAV